MLKSSAKVAFWMSSVCRKAEKSLSTLESEYGRSSWTLLKVTSFSIGHDGLSSNGQSFRAGVNDVEDVLVLDISGSNDPFDAVAHPFEVVCETVESLFGLPSLMDCSLLGCVAALTWLIALDRPTRLSRAC